MKNEINCSAVILAAGNGTRMQTATKKQFICLNDVPIIVHTVIAISKSDFVKEVIIVCSEMDIIFLKELVEDYELDKVTQIVVGGDTRGKSSKLGIDNVSDECNTILIHDGVRPIIDEEILNNCIKDGFSYGASTLGVKPKDTLKQINTDNKVINTVDRESTIIVQTPQCFKKEVIFKAYENFDENLTDDCSQVEKMGISTYVTMGDYRNIKITTIEDLTIAQKFLYEDE